MAEMKDSTLLAIVDQRCRDAEGMGKTTLAKDRTTALRYYRGDKFGDEQDGRSQVVSRDVAESIDSTLPSLMRIFASGDQVVMCEPTGPEDEDAAAQATDYANYVWNQQNAGFRIFYWWFKDALLQKLGIVKIWWDATPKITREEYEGLTEAEADELRADPTIEVVEESEPYEADEGDDATQVPLAPPLSPEIMAGISMPAAMAAPGAPPFPPGVPHGNGMMAPPQPPMPPGMMAPGQPGLPPGVPNIPPMAGMPGAPPLALPPPAPPKLVDITVRRTNKKGRICVENVPNEEFGMSRRAISVETADYTHHRRKLTLSDLRGMGYPQSKIDKIPTDDLDALSLEKAVRFEDDGTTTPDDTGVMDPSMRSVWLTEAYLLVDFDGDGRAEMRRVTWAGNQIFENEETDENPFACLTPTLMPHKAVGLSMADQVMDLQRVKSTLWRNFLDNVYLQSAPALAVHDDQVIDYNEWLTRRVGQILRTKGPPASAFAALPTQFVGGEVFPAIEYIDSVREQRTGSTRYNQGLDANSLNKTATGINMIQQAAGQRVELIARSFAETGVKPAFRKLLKLASQYSEQDQVIRLRGKWVNVDPRAWADGFDMSVSVGLGTGNKDQQVAHMMALLQVDQTIVQMQQGVQGPLLTAENLYKKLEKLVQAMGMHSVEPYYSDPESPKMQASLQAKQPPPPDPALAAVNVQQQVEAAKAQNDQHKLQVDAMDKQANQQLAQRKQAADEQFKSRELAIREREAAIKEAELGVKSSDTQIRASLEQAKIVDGQQARVDAQAAAREARMHEAMAARDAAFGTPANGQPAPIEMMQQHAQRLDALAGAVESLRQPKRGRMVKRQDGVWDFHVEAPGGEAGAGAGNGVNGNV